MRPCVLFFGAKALEGPMVQNTLSPLGLEVRVPERARYGQPIGLLADGGPMPPVKQDGVQPLAAPVLVFCGVPEETTDRALDTLRGAGLCTGALKAILTPANRYWNAPMLARELMKEHRKFEQRAKKR
ncbi:MAG: DUF3783 domain-containing protein [Clostridiales bacterium]|nr:DUF3783 domain-containing protein [Clostridiales bacterium]